MVQCQLIALNKVAIGTSVSNLLTSSLIQFLECFIFISLIDEFC